MNCKPGDLAIVVTTNERYNNRIVEVLYAPPGRSFTLPDGYPCVHEIADPCWVLKFIGGPAIATLEGGGTRQAWYGVGGDKSLRPLRDDPDAVDQPTVDELTIS